MLVIRIICILLCLYFAKAKFKVIFKSHTGKQEEVKEELDQDIQELEGMAKVIPIELMERFVFGIFLGVTIFYALLWIFIVIVFPFHPAWWTVGVTIVTVILIWFFRQNSMDLMKVSQGENMDTSKLHNILYLVDFAYLMFALVILILGMFI